MFREHDAFGGTGGAGGVNQVGERVRCTVQTVKGRAVTGHAALDPFALGRTIPDGDSLIQKDDLFYAR